MLVDCRWSYDTLDGGQENRSVVGECGDHDPLASKRDCEIDDRAVRDEGLGPGSA